MAEAKYHTRMIEEAVVTLILTPDEAAKLARILCYVSGDTDLHRIDEALCAACISPDWTLHCEGTIGIGEEAVA